MAKFVKMRRRDEEGEGSDWAYADVPAKAVAYHEDRGYVVVTEEDLAAEAEAAKKEAALPTDAVVDGTAKEQGDDAPKPDAAKKAEQQTPDQQAKATPPGGPVPLPK